MIDKLVLIPLSMLIVLSQTEAFERRNGSCDVSYVGILKTKCDSQIFYSDMYAYYKLNVTNARDKKIYSIENVTITWPAISPDGRFLAFVHVDIDTNTLFIVNLHSKRTVKRISLRLVRQMSWSTQEYKLLFIASGENDYGQLFMFDLRENRLDTLEIGVNVRIRRHSTPPVFREKDGSIMFAGIDGFIYKYSLKDCTLTKIVRGSNPIHLDSNRIIYERSGGNYFLRELGTEAERLILPNVSLGVPVISPDKKFLIYPEVFGEKLLPFMPSKHEMVRYYVCDIQGKNREKIHTGYAEFNWITEQESRKSYNTLNTGNIRNIKVRS